MKPVPLWRITIAGVCNGLAFLLVLASLNFIVNDSPSEVSKNYDYISMRLIGSAGILFLGSAWFVVMEAYMYNKKETTND